MLRVDFAIESFETTAPLTIPRSSGSNDDASFTTQTLEQLSLASVHDLKAEIDNLPSRVVRAKGIVTVGTQNYLVQRVGTHTSITVTDLSPTGIVVIYAD
jgi:hypothetical protein